MEQIPNDWTFKTKTVADQFDLHVREQLPWYELATGLVSHTVRHYLPEGGLIYDIGASTGNIEKAIGDTVKKRNATFVPIDNSEAMKELYSGESKLVIANAHEYEYAEYDVAILFLVLQFLDLDDRKKLINDLTDNLKPGGAIIVFDKMQVEGGYIATVMRRATIAGKVSSGTTPEEVVAKELSLGGVQRPLPEQYFETHFNGNAKEIFRFGEFAGFVIEKPE